METLCRVGATVLHGILDSIKGITVIFYLDKEANRKLSQPTTKPLLLSGSTPRTKESLSSQPRTPSSNSLVSKRIEESKVLKRVLQCSLLNGGIFMLSILFFEYAVLPGLHLFLWYLFRNSTTMTTVWGWMQPSLSLLFNSFWVAPLFLLSKIVNSLWFQDIADSAYKFRKGRPQLIASISKLIADTLISLLIQILFLLQSTLVKYLPVPVPFACTAIYMVHMSLLCSLYAFEYKWFNMGWELHKRLTYIEQNWPYFLGFGLPLAVLSELPNSIVISGCVFSVLFPLFIISANEATPKVDVCETPLKLFSIVVALTNALFRGRAKPSKAALSQPLTPGSAGAGSNTRGLTPPLSSSASAFMFQQQQQYRQHNSQKHHHQRSHHRQPSPSPSAASSSFASVQTAQLHQQQTVLNRPLRR
ncbi:etoposide-induced protein 2.4 homolog [Anopheles maculipalpis]|uniref:etoposide-induced protein 2.4 homolog n=1 Tax=Anopheles maculipalpis TaxID=1496333 RepID=UPI0021596016|nr:etoposide-induced protein 2.4 homolog [Anopheles maculipalpis]